MSNPVIYIFINKGLHMSAGKIAAQASHAAMMVWEPIDRSKWLNAAHRTIIILEGRDEGHMRNIESYISERGFLSHKIIDEGVNETDPHVITALSTDILDKEDAHVISTSSTFNLYRDAIKISMEIER